MTISETKLGCCGDSLLRDAYSSLRAYVAAIHLSAKGALLEVGLSSNSHQDSRFFQSFLLPRFLISYPRSVRFAGFVWSVFLLNFP